MPGPSPASKTAAVRWGNIEPPVRTKTTLTWEMAARGEGDSVSYDPDAFYVRATNKRGFGERMSFRVPPDMYARIQVLVNNEAFPDYKMPADFARDAMMHELQRRTAQIGDPKLVAQLDEITRRITFAEFSERVKAEVQHWETVENDFHESMTRLARAEAWGQVWAYLETAEDLADPCPNPYRRRMMTLIGEWREKVPSEYRFYS